MPIASLYFTDIGPFDEIEFEFDREVNVFTGPNMERDVRCRTPTDGG